MTANDKCHYCLCLDFYQLVMLIFSFLLFYNSSWLSAIGSGGQVSRKNLSKEVWQVIAMWAVFSDTKC